VGYQTERSSDRLDAASAGLFPSPGLKPACGAFRDIDRFPYQSPGGFLRWLSSIADRAMIDRVRYPSRQRRAGEEVWFRRPTAGGRRCAAPLGRQSGRTRTGRHPHAEPAVGATGSRGACASPFPAPPHRT